MTNSNKNIKHAFSLRKVGETSLLDIQAQCYDSEFGLGMEYSLEESGQGIAEFRAKEVSHALHCMLKFGEGSLMSPECSYDQLEIVMFEVNANVRNFKRVIIPEQIQITIAKELGMFKPMVCDFENRFKELLSLENLEIIE